MRRVGRIDKRAVIGQPAESRSYQGKPIKPFVSRYATVEAFATIDAGTERPTMVGDAWIFKHAHIGHDATICGDAEVSTGAIVGGHCYVGFRARIGLGAVLLPHVVVGHHSIIGAGSVVTHNVPPGQVWAGNPARYMRDVD